MFSKKKLKFWLDKICPPQSFRQLIFATHNANFVINWNAELIHILEMDEEKSSRRSSTSIENLEFREHLLSLEGRIDAFKKRE